MVSTRNPAPGTRNPKPQHGVRDVVLLHGWGSSAMVWKDLRARLGRRFRVHTPDHLGLWEAPGCTPERVAESLARRAPRRCHVVGWSLGGQVALAWAQRRPHQVRRVALISTTPCFTRRPGWTCAVAPEVLNYFVRALKINFHATLEMFAQLQVQNDERARLVIAELKQRLPRDGTRDAKALIGGLSMLLHADLRGRLATIAQPVFVLHGARDRVIPPAAGRRLAIALPDARLALLRGCAHAPFLSQPRRVARMLQGFFDE